MTAVRTIAAIALMSAPLISTTALAATSWSQPAGSSTTINYSGGQNQNGLFGDPNVSSNTFLFTPSGFSAQDNQTTTDVASTLISAKSGYNLSSFSAGLVGDYSVLDNSQPPSFKTNAIFLSGASVSAVGSLTLTNTVTHAVLTQSFNFGGFTNEDGVFNDTVHINLPAGWKSAQVDLSAGLTATASDGSTAFIQLKNASIGADTAQVAAVPLPPALLAAIPGALVAFGAARRMRRA
ncbi:MAG: hypothetical protein JWM57_1537 [Phycisphaerales bacterium]|nr:hypothetical protein [Phycisphaerales bacterium]